MFVDVGNLGLEVVINEGLYGTSLHGEIDLLLGDNVGIAQLVPYDAVVIFDIIVFDFVILIYIPNDDAVRIT